MQTVELHTLRILEGDKCPTLRHVDTIGWGTHVHSKDAAEASWPECSYNVNTIFNVIAIQRLEFKLTDTTCTSLN